VLTRLQPKRREGMPETKGKRTEARETSSLVEVTRTLEQARDATHGYEVKALAGVWLQHWSRRRRDWQRPPKSCTRCKPRNGLDAEQMRSYLSRTPKQWERIAPMLPRHYVTERGILYNRREIDEWLMERRSPLDVSRMELRR
jgi:hypothetical protein